MGKSSLATPEMERQIMTTKTTSLIALSLTGIAAAMLRWQDWLFLPSVALVTAGLWGTQRLVARLTEVPGRYQRHAMKSIGPSRGRIVAVGALSGICLVGGTLIVHE